MNTFAAYTDTELDTAASEFAAAYKAEVARTARLGFGDSGAYYLDALHGAALELNDRRDTAAKETTTDKVGTMSSFYVRPRPQFAMAGGLLLDDTLAFYGEGPQEVMSWVNVERYRNFR